eukprot:NODE_3716_length_914_cov_11.064803_g3564_i0.p1 GENE.NODE_3716_length_914_cov_11.064803_g3564_i0~~NODE_3716_length_914_cov_11.064803_g3564_i0.p1  ORF type:complete len:217 (+),score=14.53 NODE_3716_length_914_cov_11.064803_g3564_i0:79-729(+)
MPSFLAITAVGLPGLLTLLTCGACGCYMYCLLRRRTADHDERRQSATIRHRPYPRPHPSHHPHSRVLPSTVPTSSEQNLQQTLAHPVITEQELFADWLQAVERARHSIAPFPSSPPPTSPQHSSTTLGPDSSPIFVLPDIPPLPLDVSDFADCTPCCDDADESAPAVDTHNLSLTVATPIAHSSLTLPELPPMPSDRPPPLMPDTTEGCTLQSSLC